MTRIDDYRVQLRDRTEWVSFLCSNSRLPGPRANLELMHAAAREGDLPRFLELIEQGEADACGSPASEFLTVCGIVGLGREIGRGERANLTRLREFASDARWRVREAVAMALQELGDADPHAMLDEVETWIDGTPLEQRAIVAAVCEPRLLTPAFTARALDLLDRATDSLTRPSAAPGADRMVLRQALGYGWSVLIAGDPASGKKRFERWVRRAAHRDIRWIVKENLKKERLRKLDADWVGRMREAVEQVNR